MIYKHSISQQQPQKKRTHVQVAPRTKYRGHETFLLTTFFENLRFNISSIYKKQPVDLQHLEQNYPKLYKTLESVSEYYQVSIPIVIMSFLNLELKPAEKTR